MRIFTPLRSNRLSRPGAWKIEALNVRRPWRMSWRWAPPDHDALTPLVPVEDDGLAATPDPPFDQLVPFLHRDQDHGSRTVLPHVGHQWVVRVQHGGPAPRHRLDHHPLDLGQLLQRLDLPQPQVVAG